MLYINSVPARSLQKSYKSIIEGVNTKKNPVILTRHNKPQAALVSLEDLEQIQQIKTRQASLDMLELATESKEELKSLPSDLRKLANGILYNK